MLFVSIEPSQWMRAVILRENWAGGNTELDRDMIEFEKKKWADNNNNNNTTFV